MAKKKIIFKIEKKVLTKNYYRLYIVKLKAYYKKKIKEKRKQIWII
jgi:hypothetical protein